MSKLIKVEFYMQKRSQGYYLNHAAFKTKVQKSIINQLHIMRKKSIKTK